MVGNVYWAVRTNSLYKADYVSSSKRLKSFSFISVTSHVSFTLLDLIPLSCTSFIYVSSSCCFSFSLSSCFLLSFHLLLFSFFLQSCISVSSFPVYFIFVMLSWLFAFFIHNVSSYTNTSCSQCVLFSSRSQTIQDSKAQQCYQHDIMLSSFNQCSSNIQVGDDTGSACLWRILQNSSPAKLTKLANWFYCRRLATSLYHLFKYSPPWTGNGDTNVAELI